jgi:hypothetical protein
MCNASTYGGSGIFAPMRRKGPRQVLAEVGVGTQAIAVADIDLGRLRAARHPDASARRAAHEGLTRRRQEADEPDRTPGREFMRPSAATQRTVDPTVRRIHGAGGG